MNKKTILYITELFPYPATSGAKIKCINTIQTLSKKFNITLICFSEKNVSKKNLDFVRKFASHIKVFTLPNLNQPPQDNLRFLIKNYLKLNPYFLYQFYLSEAKIYLDKLIKKLKPNIIHIDHINMAQYLPKKKNEIWILEEQNIEHQLAWMKFIHFPDLKKTKLHLLIEYFLVYLSEKKVLKKFDHIFAISKFDEQMIKRLFKLPNVTTQKLVYAPQKSSSKKLAGEGKKRKKEILFIGDITWLPNKLAVKWFTEKIFPIILKKEPRIIFNIVGEIEESFKQEFIHLKSVKIHGFQKNTAKFLNTANLFVLPFQAGGGVRVKALTAFANKLPVVTTGVGVQGIEGKNNKEYLITNNPRKFAKLCLVVIRNEKLGKIIGENGSIYFRKNHSIKNNLAFLKKYLSVTQ